MYPMRSIFLGVIVVGTISGIFGYISRDCIHQVLQLGGILFPKLLF